MQSRRRLPRTGTTALPPLLNSKPTRLLLCLLAAVLLLASALRGVRAPSPGRLLWNFGYIHTGAQCLIDRCDPYTGPSVYAESLRHHADHADFSSDSLVYPPGTLLLVLPFALIPWPVAGYLFTILSAVATLYAVYLLLGRPSPVLLLLLAAVLLTHPLSIAFSLGNPALICASLLAIACLSVDQDVYWKTGILFTGALLLKPQLCLGPVLWLVWRRETRAAALKALLAAAVFTLVAVVAYRIRLGSFDFLLHFTQDLRESLLPGHPSDSSPANRPWSTFLNLQPLLYFLAPMKASVANSVAWAVTAVCLIITWRQSRGARFPWTTLALCTLISLLPEYHRAYDRVLALLILPAIPELRPRLLWPFAAVTLVWLAWDTVLSHGGHTPPAVPINTLSELALIGLLFLQQKSTQENQGS